MRSCCFFVIAFFLIFTQPFCVADTKFDNALLLKNKNRTAYIKTLSNVISAVRFQCCEGEATAILVKDNLLTLYIFSDTYNTKTNAYEKKLIFMKKDIAFSGEMCGNRAKLAMNNSGSLQLISQNNAVGRDRWEKIITISYKKEKLVVIGVTYKYWDTLNRRNRLFCDLNLITGRGFRNDAPIKIQSKPIPLDEWSVKRSLSKNCEIK